MEHPLKRCRADDPELLKLLCERLRDYVASLPIEEASELRNDVRAALAASEPA